MRHGTRHGRHANHFNAPDLSVYVLDRPRPRLRLEKWFAFAILIASILAIALLALAN